MTFRRLNRHEWLTLTGLVAVLAGIIAYATCAGGCAIKRWERRIERIEKAADATEDVIDTADRIKDKADKLAGEKPKP